MNPLSLSSTPQDSMASTEFDLRRQARAAHQAQKKASQEKHARIATQMALGDEKAHALRGCF